ncbi:hypothetical protein J9253_09255 [Thiothrix litoralis]|jgi:hypothetical protein|uniref:Uncharacterized protein n=1 Tax=Thiothrix litoralis TaxID=2891210 RepID=A0ABX7X0C4_9GAMM|nr:hypothetical protein [Thiothrix litoralis]QTR48078.1 hypothetical protein J9253_09255 [Thiothrix litoralis]
MKEELITNNNLEIQNSNNRTYFSQRLDSAFLLQRKLFTHGKITIPIITIILAFFVAPQFLIQQYHWIPLAIGVIALSSYWFVLIKNQDGLEKKENELALQYQETHSKQDITSMQMIWFKFGPIIAYLTCIAASVIFIFVVLAIFAYLIIKYGEN